MELATYLEQIKSYQIPDEPPECTFTNNRLGFGDEYMEQITARDICLKRGLWTVIAKSWTEPLADWIGDRKVLEIMAGAGWLAKALHLHGVDIIATDNGSWDARHSEMQFLFEVHKWEATAAVREFKDAEILLVSWPPYSDDAIVHACNAWGTERPIVYIGESEGGCNAPDDFFEKFWIDKDAPEIPITRWWGLHDYVQIGYWKE